VETTTSKQIARQILHTQIPLKINHHPHRIASSSMADQQQQQQQSVFEVTPSHLHQILTIPIYRHISSPVPTKSPPKHRPHTSASTTKNPPSTQLPPKYPPHSPLKQFTNIVRVRSPIHVVVPNHVKSFNFRIFSTMRRCWGMFSIRLVLRLWNDLFRGKIPFCLPWESLARERYHPPKKWDSC